MPPHAHGGGDEEEEIIVVRTDGPPFVDVKAKQGRGFEIDFNKVQKYLGPGRISLSDYMRDLDAINKAYIPTAHRSYIYLQIGSIGMLGAFTLFIIMGIVGGETAATLAARGVVIPICLALFLLGVVSFMYSKWIEQPGIKQGAALVKKMLDDEINPRYLDSPYRVRWTIRVNMKAKKTLHMGQQFVERPVISIYCLRSPNDAGVMTDWTLPEALTTGSIMIDTTSMDKEKASSGGH